MLAWLTMAALVVVALLVWNLSKRVGSDRITELNDRRRATARLVGRGELVDGNRHIEVALAVTKSTLFYENADMQASIDLQWVREVEYVSQLITGSVVSTGRVMRLRSHSQTVEFVIPHDVVARWNAMLPPRTQFASI